MISGFHDLLRVLTLTATLTFGAPAIHHSGHVMLAERSSGVVVWSHSRRWTTKERWIRHHAMRIAVEGGLGDTATTMEQTWGFPVKTYIANVGDTRAMVYRHDFFTATYDANRVSILQMDVPGGGVSLDEGQMMAIPFMPSDAAFVRGYVADSATIVYVYHSTRLQEAFPASFWSENHDILGGKPGQFAVVLSHVSSKVDTVIVTLGDGLGIDGSSPDLGPKAPPPIFTWRNK